MAQQRKIGNSDKSITAVEWLEEQLKKQGFLYDLDIEAAKQMEKEQIINAHLTGLIHPLETEATKQAKQYYNETYGNEGV